MGAYRAVDMAASLASQLMISVLTPVSSVSYNILALLCCAALIPLALTKSPQKPPKRHACDRCWPCAIPHSQQQGWLLRPYQGPHSEWLAPSMALRLAFKLTRSPIF